MADRVAIFDPSNDFYDAYAEEHCQFSPSPSAAKRRLLRVLPAWSWREWDFFQHALPVEGSLLEIGCGRGRQVFSERRDSTIGLESSLRAARDATSHYDFVVVARLPRLPFVAESFDVLASAHVIGHIDLTQKPELFAEIARVLRPGGHTAHIIETDSDHRAVRAAKAIPEAYHDRFIAQHGHIGLQSASTVLDNFERAGLEVLQYRIVDAIIPSVLNVRTFFDHREFGDLPGLRVARALDRLTAASGLLNAGYEIGMGVFHKTAEQWFGDPGRAQFIHVLARKH